MPLHDNSRARALCAAILVALCAASPADAAPTAGDTTKALSSPAAIAIKVSPDAILAENIRATGALYAASTLEEMKLFDVVDRLVDAFQLPPKLAPKLVRPLCSDDKRALVPCALTR